MAQDRKFKHKGCSVIIREKDFDYEVKIDGEKIETSRDADTGTYYCDELPYEPQGSVEDLVKAVIDNKEES